MTLASTVREAAARFGETPAFVAAAGWALSYAQLDRLSDEVACGLAERDVREGDVVALVLPSTPEYIVAYAAAAKLGAITAGVNPRYTPPERAAVIDVAHPAHVLVTEDLAEGLPEDVPTTLVSVADTPEEILRELRRGHEGRTPPSLTDPDDPERLVAIVFTSGTTGTPKGAMFGNRELAAITASDVGEQWGGGGPMLASTQFAHIGMMTKLPWYLRTATTTYVLDRWRAVDVLRLIDAHRIATIGGIAPQVALMLRVPEFDQFDFSCVKAILMGGALSPPALVREARERFGAPYSIRYSSTESGGVGTGTSYDADDEEAFFTIGRPRGDVVVEIRDNDNQVVPHGVVGELCLRSSCMMRGYWRDAEATAVAIDADGWLHTGDLASVDDTGLVRLAGRKKEMFIRGGYNVYPAEVEAVLASHPDVAEVAIVPQTETVMGEIGVAVIVPRDPASPPSLESLRTFAADRLASYKLPERRLVVDDLPLTAMHKLDRAALCSLVEAGVDHTG